MATITGLTAERMLEIEGQTVVSGAIVNNHLILTKHDGTTVDTGVLPPGPAGPTGPAGGLIPGEIKLWPGTTLPNPAQFGKWVWADGAVYLVATYPLAAANIAAAWRTAHGQSDPGASNFRVPDLRGLTPTGLDQMPGGARANRVTRSVAITIAGKTGEEIHTITVAEMPSHGHPLVDPGHYHQYGSYPYGGNPGPYPQIGGGLDVPANIYTTFSAGTGISIGAAGSDNGHENMQPSVFVPYIVKLD
jgi:microcystin-dependent protein